MVNNQTSSDLLFEKIVDQYGESLMRLAYTYVKNHQVAEDIVQDVFLKAFEKQSDFRGESSYKTYLYRITINRSYDYFRSWSYKNLLLTDKITKIVRQEKSTELLDITENENYLLGEKILSLPIKYREVIILHYYNDYGIDEIAFILGISPNTIKTRLRRGREKLKGLIERTEGEIYGTKG
jgi:RNA polymerase sigma factor (sigma-70 family)